MSQLLKLINYLKYKNLEHEHEHQKQNITFSRNKILKLFHKD